MQVLMSLDSFELFNKYKEMNPVIHCLCSPTQGKKLLNGIMPQKLTGALVPTIFTLVHSTEDLGHKDNFSFTLCISICNFILGGVRLQQVSYLNQKLI